VTCFAKMDSNNLPSKKDSMLTNNNAASGLFNLDSVLQAGADNAQGSDVIDQLQAMQRLFDQQYGGGSLAGPADASKPTTTI
jgi:hypothetical protein